MNAYYHITKNVTPFIPIFLYITHTALKSESGAYYFDGRGDNGSIHSAAGADFHYTLESKGDYFTETLTSTDILSSVLIVEVCLCVFVCYSMFGCMSVNLVPGPSQTSMSNVMLQHSELKQITTA